MRIGADAVEARHRTGVWSLPAAMAVGLVDRQGELAGRGVIRRLCYDARSTIFRCPAPSATVFNCDLHCHSTCSDGLLAAADVATRAAANGVDLLALTDHDSLDGLSAVQAAATAAGMGFVNGVEISIEWQGLQIHMLGYAFDRSDQALNAGLASIRSGRVERAQRMSAELEKVGIEGAFDGAMRYAANPSLISRAHFGRFLVDSGVAKDLRSVFESYLVPGRPGYVDHRWATLADSLAWVHAAGGLVAVAHPGRYKLSRVEMRRFLAEFKDLGGEAIEVVSGSHTQEHVDIFARYAREYDFLASRGSDFHGPGESYFDLGQLAALPDGLKPVWAAF
ncbi:MAG: Histidinol phosphatase of the PHP family protein [Candidatus Accumulibacter regalis]|jgi:Predicted metal-dependent phosphoesterases (PHP family)|uniref:Histidinol phosphatase of the PHP family protein n=1 Tax=Accumulibacter regalis TaxID=522306 RepID=A0A011QHK0_ACCRE|nr:3',5'-nucleoside bisphosphate phosphatase [Accumulibacter sp.]EXI88802.1 MAG: Histidinol phosphatase of the PHP family protein [Candidatus Accumulibacter regalis]HRE69681.1 3',5'-nucleoside bisphosphate phosphatase [Accumulibacter sp.]HRE87005.1 3',5'-nucleoside bisphosphate phosphatase [Accumulibacter sp.]HRI90848.1 3',5'-nucleoside bisphosphate phosphatase [Accumulibacter sp.]